MKPTITISFRLLTSRFVLLLLLPIFSCFGVITATAQQSGIALDNSSQSNARRVLLGSSTTLKPNLVTVEVWAKSSQWYRSGSDNTIISNTQGGGYAIYIQGATGNLLFIAYANGTYQVASIASASALVNGNWHHFAGTWDGTTAKLYVDGVLKGSSTPLGSTYNIAYGNSANNLFLGAESAGTSTTPDANRYFDGQLDEVRIWNVTRTAAQIKAYIFKPVANNASGLLAYYKCNEGSGTTLVNSCTNTSGIDGTLVSATWFANSPIQHNGNAINLDGTDDKISTPLSLSNLSAFTLEGWVNSSGSGDRIAFFGQNDVIEFGFSDATTICGYTGTTGPGGTNSVAWTFDNTTFPFNTWHHVAFTADGTNLKLYVDGQLKSTAYNPTGNYGSSADLLNIGAAVWDNTGNNFAGSIDEVRIWNVARTQAQIQAYLNREVDPLTSTGLMAYYTFNQGIAVGNNAGLVTVTDLAGNNNGTLTNLAISGSSSNFVAQKTGLFMLPLSWLSFSARLINDGVELNWVTAQEENTREFTVERSINGSLWKDLGRVAARPNTDKSGRYQFMDPTPANGLNYYRIRQTDLDGKFQYSKTIQVNVSFKGKSLQLFPNPVTGSSFTVHSKNNGTASLYDATGKLVMRRTVASGSNTFACGELPAGIYQLACGQEKLTVVIAK